MWRLLVKLVLAGDFRTLLCFDFMCVAIDCFVSELCCDGLSGIWICLMFYCLLCLLFGLWLFACAFSFVDL